MDNISLILLMAGGSTRFNQNINKNLYEINKIPLFIYSLTKFKDLGIKNIYLVIKKDEEDQVQDILESTSNQDVKVIIGGTRRLDSVKNALKEVKTDYVLIHDSARPLTNKHDILKLINDAKIKKAKLGSLYHELTDTVKEVTSEIKHLNRSNLLAVTTPQLFHKSLYKIILDNDEDITDELSLFNELPLFIKETTPNIKITSVEDLNYLNYLNDSTAIYKVGHSFDYHNFKEGKNLILGGINIPCEFGLDGWSDADVLYHSVCEAIMGALGLGDIGYAFPDNTTENYQRNSLDFIMYAKDELHKNSYQVANIDIMIYLQKPNLKNYKPLICENLKQILNTPFVNVKATTLEKQGLVGTSKGIATETVVLIKKQG